MAFIESFWTTFLVIALAELGDKTQIMTISLACRYPRLPVLVGVISGLAFLSALAVAIGAVLFQFVPIVYVRAVAAIVFIAFGIWTFVEKEEKLKEEECNLSIKEDKRRFLKIFSKCFLMISSAEFGDKTQLSVIALSASMAEPLAIFFGAVFAFFVINAPGVFLGKKLAEIVPIKYVKIASGILFIGLGIFFILEILGFF